MEERTQEKLWTKDFVLGTAINFLLMVNYYGLMVVIADYSMKTYGSSPAVAGLAASVFIIGALIARFVTGGIMDRIGRKKLLLCGGFCEVIFSVMYIAGVPLGLLFVLRLLHGLAYGAASTTIGTIVTALVPESRKGEGVGYYMLSVTLGAAVGPFLGMFLTQNAGFMTLFITAAIVAIVCLIAVLTLHTPEVSLHTSKPAHTSFQLSDYIEFSVVSISASCALLFFCYSSLLTFLTPFTDEIGLTKPASFFFVIYALAMFVTRPFTGKLFDRKGHRIVMIPAFIAFIVGMVVLSSVHHAAALLIAAALLGYGVGAVQSSALTMAVNIAPNSRISLANSTFYIFIDAGIGIGPLLLGLIEPFAGYRGLFFGMAIVATISLISYLIVSRNKK